MDGEKKQGICEMTFDTRQLIDQGREVKEGELWFYSEMNKKIGIDIRSKRGMLQTARRCLQKENGMLFEAVVNEGLRRMKNEDKPKIIGAAISKVHRIVNKTRKSMGTIDIEKLTPEGRIEIFTGATVIHLLDQSTEQKTIKKIRAKVEINNAIPQIGDTMKLFEK